MNSLAAATVPEPVEQYRLKFHGEGGVFFFVIMKNVLLTLVTLGIYMPWAKTHRRRFVWSSIEVHGQRLAYTGTGLELFKGYLKVAAVYSVFFGLPMLLGRVDKHFAIIAQIAVVAMIALVMPFAIWWSRAYLLSRTKWRGVPLRLVGSAKPFAKTVIVGIVLTILTLGLYSPYLSNKMREQITNATYLGSQPFRYDGKGGELFKIWIKGVLLTLVTLGIYSFWLQANMQRYYIEHTTFDGARGRFGLTGGAFFNLTLGQIFGTALTLGIAFPWIMCWTISTICNGVWFEGQVDFTRIEAARGHGGAAGEGLADALGVDLGV